MCNGHVAPGDSVSNSSAKEDLKSQITELFNEIITNTLQAAKQRSQGKWTKSLNNILSAVDKSFGNQHLNQTDSSFDYNKIMEKMESIEKKIDSSSSKTYADVLKKKPIFTTVIIKPKKPDTNVEEAHRKIVRATKDDSSMHVINTSSNSRSIRITSDDKNMVSKIREKVKDIGLEEEVDVGSLKKLDPQISFIIDEDQLESVDKFKARNDIPEEMEVTIVNTVPFRSRKNQSKLRIVIRMAREARQKIENRDFVFMGSQSAPYKNDFYIRSCSNCNRFGHSTKFCNNQPQCYKCPENDNVHSSKQCEKENQMSGCSFCKNNNISDNQHAPRSPQCVSFNNSINLIKSITDWDYED
ncbi:uncharacterized protein LOC128393234 [Panonychus citri]|uniref:uncharacterized protein LOC128393234 n=1 Tax=Panonychus citri TaxID=50023 RepID=UPI002307A09A|nr:uncharacterized protein LOC128393234 [Panonychus citri]